MVQQHQRQNSQKFCSFWCCGRSVKTVKSRLTFIYKNLNRTQPRLFQHVTCAHGSHAQVQVFQTTPPPCKHEHLLWGTVWLSRASEPAALLGPSLHKKVSWRQTSENKNFSRNFRAVTVLLQLKHTNLLKQRREVGSRSSFSLLVQKRPKYLLIPTCDWWMDPLPFQHYKQTYTT